MIEIVERIRSGEILPSEHLEEVIQVIEEKEPALNAFITLDLEGARKRARMLDRMAKTGSDLPLLGAVVAVKDNIAVEGLPLTCGSKMLRGFISPYDATVVERLKSAGAVIVGKANMDEFACGSSGETSAFGPTRNPHDPDRVPGGSSSGSAVAVASGMSDVALGSDTGGSIRNPASFTGVYGFKPTYNLVSRYGLVDLAMSLDVIGPLGRSVKDLVVVMNVIQGPDGRDAGVRRNLDFNVTVDPQRIRVGYSEAFLEGVEKPVRRWFERFLDALERMGSELVEVSLPSIKKIWPLYYVIMYPEFASAMQRYSGLTYGYRSEGDALEEVISASRSEALGKEVKRRILLGTYLSMEKYEKSFYDRALKLRRGLGAWIRKTFKNVDLLASPTVPFLPFKLGERIKDPLKMYASDALTVLANLTGIPALNVPFGRERDLPVGMQLMGRWFEDNILLAYARELEGKT